MVKIISCVFALLLCGCVSQPEPKKDFFNSKINDNGWRIFSFSVAIPELAKKGRHKGGRSGRGKTNSDGKGPRPRGSKDHTSVPKNDRLNKIIENKLPRYLNKFPACVKGYEEYDRYFGAAYMTIKGRCLVKPSVN